MAKSKNVTAAQVSEFLEHLDAVRGECADITKALVNCKIDTIPQAYAVAKALISSASQMAEAANRFLNRHDFQLMEGETETLKEQIRKEFDAIGNE